jgi:hypothetical protein
MIREGERVKVVAREVSPATHKYAGQKGYVTMISPSICGPLLIVQLDNNPDGIDTAFEEADLKEVPPLEDLVTKGASVVPTRWEALAPSCSTPTSVNT